MKSESTKKRPGFALYCLAIVAGAVTYLGVDAYLPDDNRWEPVLIAAVLATAASVASVQMLRLRRGVGPKKLPARQRDMGKRLLIWQVMLIALGWLLNDSWSPNDFGVSNDVHPFVAIVAGFVLYFCLVVPWYFSIKRLGILDQQRISSFEALRAFLPREKHQKPLALFAVCVLNPITEEILYRGILVYCLGTLVENYGLAAVAGFAFSLAAHAYQGVRSLVFQAFFHGLAIAVLFTPLGLLGSIGLHLAGDSVPLFGARSQMRWWAQQRRRLLAANIGG